MSEYITIGIDIDGVLGRVAAAGTIEPWWGTTILRNLLALLADEWCTIILLTSCCGPDNDPERYRETRRHHLDLLGFGSAQFPLSNLVLTRYGEKGLACRAHGVDLFIDDSPENIADVKRDSPGTICFLMATPAVPGERPLCAGS